MGALTIIFQSHCWEQSQSPDSLSNALWEGAAPSSAPARLLHAMPLTTGFLALLLNDPVDLSVQVFVFCSYLYRKDSSGKNVLR